MTILWNVFILFIVGMFVLYSPVYAMETQQSNCSSYDAIYEPQTLSNKNQYSYKLEIKKAEDSYPGSVSAYLYFYTYNIETEEPVNRFLLNYGCSASGRTSCEAAISMGYADKIRKFEIVALNKDFSQNYYEISEVAPYALIVAGLDTGLYYFPWEQQKEAIEYYTTDKITPKYTGIPEVWMLTSCRGS